MRSGKCWAQLSKDGWSQAPACKGGSGPRHRRCQGNKKDTGLDRSGVRHSRGERVKPSPDPGAPQWRPSEPLRTTQGVQQVDIHGGTLCPPLGPHSWLPLDQVCEGEGQGDAPSEFSPAERTKPRDLPRPSSTQRPLCPEHSGLPPAVPEGQLSSLGSLALNLTLTLTKVSPGAWHPAPPLALSQGHTHSPQPSPPPLESPTPSGVPFYPHLSPVRSSLLTCGGFHVICFCCCLQIVLL